MARINKITTGYVIQVFDTEIQRFVSQEFVAGETVDYEDDQYGEPIDIEDTPGIENAYMPFEMVQPVFETPPAPPLGFGTGDKIAWVRWYQSIHKGIGLKDAAAEYERRMDALLDNTGSL